jgi:hypothetical protein
VTEPKRFSAILLGLIAAALLILAYQSRAQSHECQGGHNCNDGGAVTIDNVLTGGDNVATISGGRAYALGGSDMDINDCLATFSYVFGIIQDVRTNPFCFAMQLDSIGKHREAAEMRCSVRRVKKIFKDDCVESMTAKPTVIVPQTPQDDTRIAALYARMTAYEERTVKAEAEAKTARIQAQRASTVAQTVQIQQQAPDDAAERRTRAREAYMKAKEE